MGRQHFRTCQSGTCHSAQLTFCLLMLFTGGLCAAQQPSQPAQSGDSGRRTATSAPQTSSLPDEIPVINGVQATGDGELLLRTDTGQLIPLRELLGFDYRNVVDDLLNRGRQQLTVPRFEVARLELTGDVDTDVITLIAELTIRIQKDHEWVTVPVAFSDLHIDDIAHEAEAAHGRAIPETSDPAQKRWHLYGIGLHTIRLKLIGRTRPQSPSGHTLTLSLPRSTISHARIRFASPVEIQREPVDSVGRITADDAGVHEVEYWGLSPTFSMTWVDVVTRIQRRPVIQVQSNRMKLDLNSIPVALTGTQILQISGSPVNELTVLFPPGFLLLEVAALNQAGVPMMTSFEVTSVQNGSSTVVRLSGPMEGLLTLNYEMELLNRTFPQDVQVRLPVVRNANAQSGDLDIMIPPGLQVQQTRVEAAQRKRVTSEVDINVQATAFRLRSVDSLIVLRVEEIQALYAVSPELILEPDADNILITARFPVNVLTGSLLDLQIRWPGYSGSIWQLLPGTTALISEKQSRPLSLEQFGDDGDTFRLTFPERQSGQFRVEFRAFTSVAALRSSRSALKCPFVETIQLEPVIITTLESDVYSMQPVNAETSRTLPQAPFQSSAIAEAAARNRAAQTWLHSQPEAPLSFELIRQAPSVTTSMAVRLAPRDPGIEVRQEILYQIEHSELTSLSLIVPEGVQPSVSVAGESERLRAALDSATSWSFRLPSPRRGSFRIVVDYLWQVPADETGDSLQFELPLVLPHGSDMTRCEVGASVASGLQVKDSDNWAPVYSERSEAAWMIAGPASSVPISWRRSVSLNPANSPMFLMSRTRLAIAEAVTTTVAVYERLPQQFSFELPASVRPISISLNGRSIRDLNGRVYQSRSSGRVRWTIPAQTSAPLSDTGISEGGNPSTEDSDLQSAEGATVARGTSAGMPFQTDAPVLMEIQTRERSEASSALWHVAGFHRPEFESTALPIPSLWFLESQDNLRVAGRLPSQIQMTQFPLLPFRGSAHIVSDDPRVLAILSSYSETARAELAAGIDAWLSVENNQAVFFTMSDSGPLSVYLVPAVSLLLISASVCVIFFTLMIVFRMPSLAVPLLLIASAVPAMYLAWPDWTVITAPYGLMGVIFGIVALIFQKLATDHRLRLPGLNRSGESLTVFGYTGFLSGSSSVVGSDAIVSGGSEASVPSIR